MDQFTLGERNQFGAPFSLTRREPRHSHSWLRTLGCRGSTDDALDCDEYPYASTHQGGPNGLVTHRILGASDNRSAGALLNVFYGRCSIRGNTNWGDQFFVVPLEGTPTLGLCER